MKETHVIRELFIEELAEVNGGGPIEDLLALIPTINPNPELGVLPGGYSTMACGEECPENCC